MLKTIPTWIWYVVAGAVLIAAIVAGAEYYEAAASLESLLPGGEGTGG
jgi:hypothetical protein